MKKVEKDLELIKRAEDCVKELNRVFNLPPDETEKIRVYGKNWYQEGLNDGRVEVIKKIEDNFKVDDTELGYEIFAAKTEWEKFKRGLRKNEF
jgi:hypothetical protein